MFLFLCGGDESNPQYICRRDTAVYIKKHEKLNTLLCVKPETLLSSSNKTIKAMDLFDLEKIIADLSDAILLFDESPGSTCELGAFAMNDEVRRMMTVVVPKRYENGNSFIIQGPVRHIENQSKKEKSPLSSVMYVDINCPFISEQLGNYLLNLRKCVFEERRFNKNRNMFKPNNNKNCVYIFSMCRELLDLISIFAPIKDNELFNIYLKFKGFDEIHYKSRFFDTLPRDFDYRVLLVFLSSTNLISYGNDGMVDMKGDVPAYFMFNQSSRKDILKIRARVLAAKRKRRDTCASLYCE